MINKQNLRGRRGPKRGGVREMREAAREERVARSALAQRVIHALTVGAHAETAGTGRDGGAPTNGVGPKTIRAENGRVGRCG